jgi:hypothetical protein
MIKPSSFKEVSIHVNLIALGEVTTALKLKGVYGGSDVSTGCDGCEDDPVSQDTIKNKPMINRNGSSLFI